MVEITRLFWKKAFTTDNFELGEVHSAELDMSTWRVTSLYVNLTDEASKAFGFKIPYLGRVTVCLPVTSVKSVADVAILNQSLDELRTLKQCKE